MDLNEDQRIRLRTLVNSPGVSADVATRARIVLWYAENRSRKEVAELAGVSRPTVDLWVGRFMGEGIAGLSGRKRGAAREQMSPRIRARILALARTSPPAETGLSHWSSREMADYVRRTENTYVSHHYVAKLWRENGLKPHRQGTFKVSRDPAFAEKVADIVGLYLDPPGGAVVLSIDEKTQIQALDRTQPMLPMTFGATEQRTADYVRHGTTNLFASLNVGTGEVFGLCSSTRDGAEFLGFLKKAVKPHAGKDVHVVLDILAGKDVHVVLDNLSTHNTPDVQDWLERNPNVTFHFTPTGSSWLNQVEIWFGNITRQSIRRGTFSSVRVLINQIRDYINHWNANAKPFTWTATPDEILAQVRVVQTSIKKLVDNNAK